MRSSKDEKKSAFVDWHPADVVAALWKRGLSFRRLSLQNGYRAQSLRVALRTPWPKAEAIIAAALGMQPQQIWPSRYRPDGNPKSDRGERGIRRYRRKDTSAEQPRKVKHDRSDQT